MNDQKFDINSLRIASPCSVGWENMTGDERTRHCDLCSLNVYNISELNTREVERLIQKREGRLCIRMYRRADGTVLTRDCPVGLRAVQKCVSRFAGAALAAILGLFSVSFGQKAEMDSIDASKAKIVRKVSQTQESELNGTFTDPNGAVIPDLEIKLYKNDDKNSAKTTTNDEGGFRFKALKKGVYTLEVKASYGFSAKKITGIEINPNESISLDISLAPSSTDVVVGIYAAEPPMVDLSPPTVTTLMTTEIIRRRPD